MKKKFIRGRLDKYDDSVAGAQGAGLDFVLGGTGTKSGHGQAGVSNAAASAIWMADYSLQAAVRGIQGCTFITGLAFQPLDHIGQNIETYDPEAVHHVMLLYYGFLMVADAIEDSGDALSRATIEP
ncbi:hypothetical protein BDV19DRAFT_390294 [Aspergillus venezuelensis]